MFRKVSRRMEEYIKKYYNKIAIHYNVYHNDFMNKINISISGKLIDHKNSWNGEWISIWELDIGTKKMYGEILINTMYFQKKLRN